MYFSLFAFTPDYTKQEKKHPYLRLLAEIEKIQHNKTSLKKENEESDHIRKIEVVLKFGWYKGILIHLCIVHK